jgi:MYXO-CTERM domain-containing protein
LQACADQLAAEFSFNIDVTAHVAVSGNGTVTTTNGNGTKTTTKCSFSPPARGRSGMLFGALAVLGVAVARRRRH